MCLLPRVPGQCPGISVCNPKHTLAVVVSSLVAHQIPPAAVVCLFVCLFVRLFVWVFHTTIADELKLPPGLDDVSVYN